MINLVKKDSRAEAEALLPVLPGASPEQVLEDSLVGARSLEDLSHSRRLVLGVDLEGGLAQRIQTRFLSEFLNDAARMIRISDPIQADIW